MHLRLSLSLCSLAALAALAVLAPPVSAIAQDVDRAANTRKLASATAPYGIITTVAGTGWAGYFGDGGPATAAELYLPYGVAVDSSGNLYIADAADHVVRKVTAPAGIISTLAGSLESGYAGDGGQATKALMNLPTGIALDAGAANLYIADTGNNVIRAINLSTGIITTVAGKFYGEENRVACQYTGDNGPATSAQLCRPQGVALDAAGDLFIADTDNNVIREVNAKTHTITTVAGNPWGGLLASVATQIPATSALLDQPQAIALDSQGNLFIADTDACLVRKVTASTGMMTIVAGLVAPGADGDCDFTEEGVPATQSPIENPVAIAVDADGNLFFGDDLNSLVRRVDAKTGIMTTLAGDLVLADINTEGQPAGQGETGYSGDGGAANVAMLAGPQGLAFDSQDNLYIADSANSVVRKVNGTLSATTPPPTLTPPAMGLGLGFSTTQTVTISDTASGATIYYTTDGSTPNTSSTKYAGPIQLSKSAPIIAFAASSAAQNSYAAQGNYYQLPAPVITPNGGSFTQPQGVEIMSSNPAATILITTDGTDPRTSDTALIYIPPMLLTTTTTVHAVAEISGGFGSESTATFILPSAPVAVTGTPTNLTATTATLSGTVNPGLLTTTWQFLYGTACTSLTASTPVQTLGVSSATQTVTANITGLTPGASYCFKLTATNNDGASTGKNVNFFTALPAPVVVTGTATNLAATTATLNGTVNPSQQATTYWFAYGKSCSALSTTTTKQSLAATGATINVSATLTALTKSASYCFQLTATNNGGTSTGKTAMFTTPN